MTHPMDERLFLAIVYDYMTEREWKYKGDIPAVIFFSRPFLPPCRIMAPVLDELSEEYEGRVHFFEVNAEHEFSLARAFGIKKVPSFVFIPSAGRPIMATGMLPKGQVREIIEADIFGRDCVSKSEVPR